MGAIHELDFPPPQHAHTSSAGHHSGMLATIGGAVGASVYVALMFFILGVGALVTIPLYFIGWILRTLMWPFWRIGAIARNLRSMLLPA